MKKLLALFIILFSLSIFSPDASAGTIYSNCSAEQMLPSPYVPGYACTSKYPSGVPGQPAKYLSPNENCSTVLNGEVCCCEQIHQYECKWKMVSTEVNGDDIQMVDCEYPDVKGTDCDPTKKPGGGGPASACCCAGAESVFKYTSAAWTMPELSIPINTVHFSDATCDDPDSPTTCKIPWISQYIDGVYRFGLGIGGILAAIMLMAGGILWLISAGDASRITTAKSLIIGSITGLIILVGTYTLLNLINPDLVKLQGVTLKMIDRIEIESLANGSDSESNGSGKCADEDDLVDIKQIVSSRATSPLLSNVAFGGLKKAVNEAKSHNRELLVTSAFRTADHQRTLWDNAVKKYGDENIAAKYVARPGGCGGHRNGQAIDVCLKGSPSCSKMNSQNAQASDEDIVLLQQIMQAAGWKRYCGEWWHFQYQDEPGQSCSP